MAILNKDEYINTIHLRLGSDNSDDAIKFLEDMVDKAGSGRLTV